MLQKTSIMNPLMKIMKPISVAYAVHAESSPEPLDALASVSVMYEFNLSFFSM